MAVTLTQLAGFLAVVRRGSVTAAAKELIVTQPSVSSAVAALERELGVRLTERVGRTLRPTEAGAAYAPYAAEVLGLLEAGRRAAREAAGHERRRLRISAVTTAAEYLVPQLIQAFGQRHPEFEISLEVGNREEVFRRLTDHQVDVAITGRPPAEARVEGCAFADNDFVLVTSVGDPLAGRAGVGIEELAERAWLVREPGSGTRALCDEFLDARDLSPRVFTLGSNGAIKQAARAGLGIALQARVAVALELELGLLELVELEDRLPHRRWYAACSSVGPVSEGAQAFVAFVHSAAGQEALARVLPAAAARPASDEFAAVGVGGAPAVGVDGSSGIRVDGAPAIGVDGSLGGPPDRITNGMRHARRAADRPAR